MSSEALSNLTPPITPPQQRRGVSNFGPGEDGKYRVNDSRSDSETPSAASTTQHDAIISSVSRPTSEDRSVNSPPAPSTAFASAGALDNGIIGNSRTTHGNNSATPTNAPISATELASVHTGIAKSANATMSYFFSDKFVVVERALRRSGPANYGTKGEYSSYRITVTALAPPRTEGDDVSTYVVYRRFRKYEDVARVCEY